MDRIESRFSLRGGRQKGQSTPVEALLPSASIIGGIVPPSTDNEGEGEIDPVVKSEKRHGPHVMSPSCECRQGLTGRNLVLCIDGTANQFSIKNTNVVELYSRLEKDSTQLTYYDSGIGTYVKDSKISPSYWKQWATHTIDMMIAWNFKRIVLTAYQWLSENYLEGDRIFLFGFSRGAYQVRVIAGMIEKVGLLHKGNNNQIAFAYELYISTTASRERFATGPAPVNKQENTQEELSNVNKREFTQGELCARFKATLSRPDVKVHFVGAWDTVSSIGVARGPSLPETTTGMRHVCVFRHALALDERRCKFLPEYANGNRGPSAGDDVEGRFNEGDVKEVWFAGSHSDIGGGNIPNMGLNQFGPALRWMSYEAMRHGLRIKPFRGEWKSIRPNPSLTGVWKILEILPLRRLSYKDKKTTRIPHFGEFRQVKAGQLIHESAFEVEGYKMKANLPSHWSWEKKELKDLGVIEPDPYLSAGIVLSELETAERVSAGQLSVLDTLMSSKDGRQSLMDIPNTADILFNALQKEGEALQKENDEVSDKTHTSIISSLVCMIAKFPFQSQDMKRYPKDRMEKLEETLKHILKQTDNQTALTDVITMFLNAELNVCTGHTDAIWPVAFSPDGKCIVSGSFDNTICIWDAETGRAMCEPLMGHTGSITSVAFSPDGKHIVSGSWDMTICIWDPETGKSVGEPLVGHANIITSVTFSPDGKHIVSSSRDKTICLWDVKTGRSVGDPLIKHTDPITSVAFSPDGKYIVSGSWDHRIHIWNAETGENVGEQFIGHTEMVLSVAFSPDGKYIVSGSMDRTICIWDVKTGKKVGGSLIEHYGVVSSVAFSPDGKYIISGSWNGKIYIWDAKTGKNVGVPLIGHIGTVSSVAFSPDGKYIVSGSSDKTVRIWDAKTGRSVD